MRETIALREQMKKWVDSKETRTIPKLSKKCDVSERTLYQTIQGECNPTLETALKILKHITTTKEEIRDILKQDFSEFIDRLDSVTITYEDRSIPTNALKQHLETYLGCQIINIAACRCGASYDELIKKFGEDGINYIETLINEGILKRHENILRLINNNFGTTDEINIANQINIFTKIYSPKKQSEITLQTESVNEKCIFKLKKLFIKYNKEVNELLNNEEHNGNIPIYVANLMNFIINKE